MDSQSRQRPTPTSNGRRSLNDEALGLNAPGRRSDVTSTTPSNQNTGLPAGWEMRLTQEGRPYYVDHNTVSTFAALPFLIPDQTQIQRSTTWNRPGVVHDSESLGPLPTGWEIRKTANGRTFYVEYVCFVCFVHDLQLTVF